MWWMVKTTPLVALPPGKTRYPLNRRLGGPQGRCWRVGKISPPTRIRSPDRPARSKSLYRLSYPGPLVVPGGNIDLQRIFGNFSPTILTLILLMWRIWWTPNNATKWQMGFNSAFQVLNHEHSVWMTVWYEGHPTYQTVIQIPSIA